MLHSGRRFTQLEISVTLPSEQRACRPGNSSPLRTCSEVLGGSAPPGTNAPPHWQEEKGTESRAHPTPRCRGCRAARPPASAFPLHEVKTSRQDAARQPGRLQQRRARPACRGATSQGLPPPAHGDPFHVSAGLSPQGLTSLHRTGHPPPATGDPGPAPHPVKHRQPGHTARAEGRTHHISGNRVLRPSQL